MERNVGIELAESSRGYLMAPAGYGKTHSIALAVKEAFATKGKQLILTHTHAGVHSLGSKLKKLGIPRNAFNVETIAGWSLKYATAFRSISKLRDTQPSGPTWEDVYPSALACLRVPAVLNVLVETYGGLFVDEYQDCTQAQHELILYIAEHIPCRILGDPLQGVFEFESSTIDLNTHLSSFTELEPLNIPYRWVNAGSSELGDWLQDTRKRIEALEQIDLIAPVKHIASDRQILNSECIGLLHGAGTVLVVHKVDNQAHSFAKGIGGKFRSMEEMDCKRLMKFAIALDMGDSVAQARAVLSFAAETTSNCMALSQLDNSLAKSRNISLGRYRSNGELAKCVQDVVDGGGCGSLLQVLNLIENFAGVNVFRDELWKEGRRCLNAMESGKYGDFASAAFSVREMTRRIGRRSERFTSSRVLLVKGLEYDHVVVAAAESMSEKELYVALTRGAKTLIVQNASQQIRFSTPKLKAKKNSNLAGTQTSLFDETLDIR